MKGLQLLYVPVPDAVCGKELVQTALGKKLAACGNLIGPMTSFYEWQGVAQESAEYLLILKTTCEKRDGLCELMEKLHPYECPCITHFPVEANPAFAAWVNAQC